MNLMESHSQYNLRENKVPVRSAAQRGGAGLGRPGAAGGGTLTKNHGAKWALSYRRTTQTRSWTAEKGPGRGRRPGAPSAPAERSPGPLAGASPREGPPRNAARAEGRLPQRGPWGPAAASVLLLVLVEVVVVVLVFPDAGHGRLHPGAAVLGPAGAGGRHAVRTVGQVAAGTRDRAVSGTQAERGAPASAPSLVTPTSQQRWLSHDTGCYVTNKPRRAHTANHRPFQA